MNFDAQCDVASIVYRPGDDPDGLLVAFADDLRRSGFHAAGVIQVGHSCHAADPGLGVPGLGVITLPERTLVKLTFDEQTSSSGCRLDDGRLADIAHQLAAAIDAGADLVIINRFGHSEVEGGGLVDIIAQALEADIPVLIAVSEARFAPWIRFCGGMNVRLGCDRHELDRWWRSVSATMPQLRPDAGMTFCEIAK